MPKVVEFPEEHLPEHHKQWYWSRLLWVTWVFFLLWTVIAVWWHIPAPHAWRNVLLFGNMPLHWYLPAFFSIWVGVALIFIYHVVMSRVDEAFRALALQDWEALPEDVRMSLRLVGVAPAGEQRS